MRLKLYCDLYVSECWQKKKSEILNKLRSKRLMPCAYVLTLSGGEQNHLEFYPGAFLKQHYFDDRDIFVVGIADGYDECLGMIERIADKVYQETGGADIRTYILDRQREHEKTGR